MRFTGIVACAALWALLTGCATSATTNQAPPAPSLKQVAFQAAVSDASDLFRPCPDPETDDTACNVAFPVENGLPVAPTVKGVDDYLAWFNGTYAWAYAPGGAPWTRLGYTYDWNPDTPKFGASEYLITKGAVWQVAGAAPVDGYCRR